jgi:Zn-dependent protease
MDPDKLSLGLMWYLAFLLSLTCHEAAHALVGLWGGDRTAADGGQVSLNPLPHIQREPMGTIFIPWVSYLLGGWMIGWASAPYDPYWRMRYPRRGAWVSLAGPLANFLLALIAGLALKLGLAVAVFQRTDSPGLERLLDGSGFFAGLAVFLSILFFLNVLLGVFNLIPVPPLDGFGALALVLPSSVANRMEELRQQPMVQMIGLLLAWNFSGFIVGPALDIALMLLFPSGLLR